MSVINTDEWLLDSFDDPVKMCEKLTHHFNGIESIEIYQYLSTHGMYPYPKNDGQSLINDLKQKKMWELVQIEEEKLKQIWSGPNVPIFIFPANTYNRKLMKDFNGKSGLAFKDKLFLFVSKNNSEDEIKALFTHEYNHVCRLSKYNKKEEDYVLLDTMILEGLAENAVREQLGSENTAHWTSFYSTHQLEKMWKRHIFPRINSPVHSDNHQKILYGLGMYPKMAGYCVGYDLVKTYLKDQQCQVNDLFKLPSKKIAQI